MATLTMLVRWTGGRPWIRGVWLAVLTSVGLMALPAAAQASDTWTGASNGPAWSDPSNWSSGAPTSPAGTLTFPDLGSCVGPATCYTSTNDVSNLSVGGLVFGNASGQYRIGGDSLTLGSGGIADAGGGGTGDVVHAPLVVSAGSQTWTVGSAGNGYNSLTLLGGITGSTAAVTARMPKGDLFVDSDMEVGPVTSNGPGGFHIGGPPGSNNPGSVNATDGEPFTINGGSLVTNPGSRTGSLTVNGGTLLLGTNPQNNGTTTLDVNGAATLGASATTTTFINDNGSTPGTDFSQLAATGHVSLAGTLSLNQGPNNGNCVALRPGDVATLVATSGTLTGTFSGVPDGTILTLASSCQATAPQVQIHYTANSVTATVVSGTTTTLATPNPSSASTNQSVTLTATVTTNTNGNDAASGSVAFSASGNPVPGCTSQPVTPSGSSGTATCTTSFAAGSSPESLTAAFTGSSGSGLAGSTSTPPQSLTVSMGLTSTTVMASTNDPGVGGVVTYTATVTPGVSGATTPAGTVAFTDNGSPMWGCSAQRLTTGSSTATCAVAYPGAGAHSITAVYGGDANFSGSTSPATSVTVQAPPVTVQAPSTISGSTSRATHVGSGMATLTGSVTPGGAPVSWKFEYGQGTAYNHATRPQTIPGGNRGTLSVSAVVKGLSPNARYHYRLVVFSQTSGNAAAHGMDLTFTTKATGRLLGPSGRMSTIRRTILVAQTCQSTVLCAGRFSLATTVRVGMHKTRSTVVCATGSFRIRPHGTATVRARLSAACLRLLKAHHSFAVTYVAQSRTGQTGLRRRIRLALGRSRFK
jgi:hypothetical protein